jgi:hypothetical protein
MPNPYTQVISIMCKTLAWFDDDKLIPTYGMLLLLLNISSTSSLCEEPSPSRSTTYHAVLGNISDGVWPCFRCCYYSTYMWRNVAWSGSRRLPSASDAPAVDTAVPSLAVQSLVGMVGKDI